MIILKEGKIKVPKPKILYGTCRICETQVKAEDNEDCVTINLCVNNITKYYVPCPFCKNHDLHTDIRLTESWKSWLGLE